MHQVFEKIDQKERFYRLVAAYRVANKHGLFNSSQVFASRLAAMGGTLDGYGNWEHHFDDHQPHDPDA